MADTGKKVLLVDDDKFLLDMYALKFSQEGFTVVPCFSVEEAVQTLRAGEKPDAILFDIAMPGEDGFDFLNRIRQEKLGGNARLIALTNQSTEADQKHAEELGAHRYVVKASMIPSEVVEVVRKELGISTSEK